MFLVICLLPEHLTAQQPKLFASGSGDSNFAIAQGYRWFSFFEIIPHDLENHMASLDDKVLLDTANGRTIGKTSYSERVAKLPANTRNGHWVQNAKAWLSADNEATVEMKVRFDHRSANGSLHSQFQSVLFLMKGMDTTSPILQAIKMTSLNEDVLNSFDFATETNRIHASILNWLAMLSFVLEGDDGDYFETLTHLTSPDLFAEPGPLASYFPQEGNNFESKIGMLSEARFKVSDCKSNPASGLMAWQIYDVTCTLTWSLLEIGAEVPTVAMSEIYLEIEDRRGPFAIISSLTVQ